MTEQEKNSLSGKENALKDTKTNENIKEPIEKEPTEQAIQDIQEQNMQKHMKKKPIFTILATFIIIVLCYFGFWYYISNKTKNTIEKLLIDNNVSYDDISFSGFPFSKKIKISDVSFKNDIFKTSSYSMMAEKLELSSFILSKKFKVAFEDISNVNRQTNEENDLEFDTEPVMNFSLYKNGELKSLYYKDTGYIITDENNVKLSSAGISEIEINSAVSKNSKDYTLKASFQNVQNFESSIKEVAESKVIPDSYNLNIDGSLTFEIEDDIRTKTNVVINELSLKNENKNIEISFSGDLESSVEDRILSGKLKIELDNFAGFKPLLYHQINVASKQIEGIDGESLDKNFNIIFDEVVNLANKNKETTDKKLVFLAKREKNTTDYTINDISLLQLFTDFTQKIQEEQTTPATEDKVVNERTEENTETLDVKTDIQTEKENIKTPEVENDTKTEKEKTIPVEEKKEEANTEKEVKKEQNNEQLK